MKDTPIWKLLLKLSPPVMLGLLIQSVYNIVDSYYVAQYSTEGLTALSIIFPIQLLMTAIATGTGTGLNILLSCMDGAKAYHSQDQLVKNGILLGCINFIVFTAIALLCLRPYCEFSSSQPLVVQYGISYSQIIFLCSLGMFLEANLTKLLQARGLMFLPMCAQITGALLNVILDPILIFGKAGIPPMGIQGAAIATIIGQWSAMIIVAIGVLHKYPLQGRFSLRLCYKIYQAGFPSIVMQSLYTLYMVGLNLILKQFTEDAVTVLGIYYKLQTFFFIPLFGLQQVILTVISFNYGAGRNDRVKQTLHCSIGFSSLFMAIGCGIFLTIPGPLLSLFSVKPEILTIGSTALRIISLSFLPAAAVIMLTVHFQAVNRGDYSIRITILRQMLLLVPLAWVFHYWGLAYVWLTFPVTEFLSLLYCLWLYSRKEPLSVYKKSYL